MSLAATEAQMRRKAQSIGLRLEKSRSRTPEDPSFGGYMILDARTNTVVEGADSFAYSLTFEEAAHILGEGFADLCPGRARDGSWRL